MTNLLILIGIIFFFIFAFYDQFGMDHLYGKTLLKVRLKKRAKIDAVIFIGLIGIIIYQSAVSIEKVSLYLLVAIIILAVYAAFIRFPALLLKNNGFFYGNLFVHYNKIHAINLTEDKILVIDLNTGKRLLIQPESAGDLIQIFDILTQLGVISKGSRQTLNQLLKK
ncbi:uncharacterized membrane protein YobD (UPF0266 family) [Cricetibacter osteomyelitidis]|uniref:UPF0266 membrane protein EDC44_1036 n=1 Tax=Cricetibacter osteomyelitidis TaxID=1521931 RepID=A0A4R2T1Q0_9PAST|nr:DUF986 family protein [Cricetibacter osteomyelitidis]TCP96809.1 uncharacterized membrane protein YobD (UPF0266 family) [Cricetibacter osteomyelitidis]